MADIVPLSEAVSALVHDGDAVAMEGFTHLIPASAGHELIRQGLGDLTLYRMTPDVVYDQLIGVGAVRRLVFSWGGNPGVGSLYRFRDAVERGWPQPLELIEHTHAAMAAGYVAAASRLPFTVIRGAMGTDLPSHPSHTRWMDSPFEPSAQRDPGDSGDPGDPGDPREADVHDRVLAVRAHAIDVTVIHAQRADRRGNVQLWGIVGIQKEAVLAAKRAIVTVEEVVDELIPVPGAVVIPGQVVTAVCAVPNGTHPSYAQGYTRRDNAFYKHWGDVSRDRDRFTAWIDRHVRGTRDMAGYLESLREAGSP